MAVASGIIVADITYLQPLLHLVRLDLHTSVAATSALLTFTQVGYVMGLALIAPLGDVWPRRRLIVGVFLVAAVAMATVAVVPNYLTLASLLFVIGVTSVGGQLLVPFAADLSPDATRGRTIGIVMSGLLSGVLLSRVVAGYVAQLFGWRGVYVVAALALVAMAMTLARYLPLEAPRERVPYTRVIAESFTMLRTSSLLRRRSWLGAATMGSLNVVWATLAFHLAASPFHYSSGTIGLFGLVGLSGIAMANVAGRLADQGRVRQTTILCAALMVVSYVLLWVGAASVLVIGFAIIVVDAGAQGMQISNQTVIYAIAPEKRSRVNSPYMVTFFMGVAAGSLGAGFAYASFGWSGACAFGLLLALASLVLAVTMRAEPTIATGSPTP